MTPAAYEAIFNHCARLLGHRNPDVRGTANDRIVAARRELERTWRVRQEH